MVQVLLAQPVKSFRIVPNDGHAGVILFRRSVSTIAYGRQAGLLLELMREAKSC